MSTPSDPTKFAARYGDGRSAASRAVTVEFAASGLLVREVDGGGSRHWPYAALVSAVPMGRSNQVGLIAFQPRGGETGADAAEAGATLFCDDPSFARSLAEHAPHLRGGRERWRFALPGIAVMILFAAIAAFVTFGAVSPSRAIAVLLPQSLWKAIGDGVFSDLSKGRPLCTRAESHRVLDGLVAQLSRTIEGQVGFDVRVVDLDLLNAFALPGQRIILTRKLLTSVGSAEELAGVIAHEMGHGLERHPEASVIRGLGLSVLVKIIFSGGGDTYSSVAVLLTQLGYSRQAEREADDHAVAILQRAQITTRPLATFFERMRAARKGRGSLPGIDALSTHPAIEERIARIEKLPPMPSRPAMSDGDFKLLASICGTMAGESR